MKQKQEELPKNLLPLVKSSKELQLAFLNSEMPISSYKSDNEKMFLKTLLKNNLSKFAALLNIGKNLSPTQVDTICELIIEEQEFKDLTPSEIREAFFKGVKGNYGKIYDRVDISIVFDWIRTYIKERDMAIEDYRVKENSMWKAESKKPYVGLERLQKIIGKQKLKTAPIKRNRSKEEIELDGYIREFEESRKSQPKDNRFIKYNGTTYDIHGYCKKRWEENNKVRIIKL